MSAVAYVVRAGFVYTDSEGAAPRTYAAGETVLLDPAVGDRAHQLERVQLPAPRPAVRRARADDAQEAPA